MRNEVELRRITYEIRGCGMRVHQKIGPGCFESAYSPCFAYELMKSKLEFRSEVPLTLCYEGVVVTDAYVADYTIEGCVVGELKAIEKLAPIHSRQMDTYLHLTGYPVGLILNFGALKFLEGIIRRANNFPFGTPPYKLASPVSGGDDVTRAARSAAVRRV